MLFKEIVVSWGNTMGENEMCQLQRVNGGYRTPTKALEVRISLVGDNSPFVKI